MQKNKVQVNYNFSRDSGLDIMNVSARGDIVKFDKRDNERVSPLGSSRMYLFNPSLFNDWLDMVLEVDGVSKDLAMVVEEVESYYKRNNNTGLMLVIEGFEINRGLREKGYGQKFLKKVLEDFRFMNIDVVGLIPGYYREATKENKENNPKIQRFYKQCGFKIINPGESTPVMKKLIVST